MDELDPRLRTHLDALDDIPPRDPQRAAEGRARFLKMAAEMKPEQLPPQAVSSGLFWRLKEWIQPKPQFRKEGLKMVNILVAALMAISVIFGGGAAAAYASQDAVPGDTLYPVKEVVEQAELALATNPQTKAELHLEFAQERAAEMQTLVMEGHAAQVPQVAQKMVEHLQAAEGLAEQLARQGQTGAVGRVAVMTGVAAQMLQQAMTHADQHAQEALQKALQRTQQAQTRAMEAYARAQQHADEAKGRAQDHAGEMVSQPNGEIFDLRGTVESIDGRTWVVSGQTVVVPEDAKVKGDVQVGDVVEIHGYVDPNGQEVVVQAHRLPNHPPVIKKVVVFQGVVEAQSETQWVVSGQAVNLTEKTKIHGQIGVGDRVLVVAEVEADGSLQARVINLIDWRGQHDGGHGEHNGYPTVIPTMPGGMPTFTPEPGHDGNHDGGQDGYPMPTPTMWGGMGGWGPTSTPEPGHNGGHEGGHH